MKPIIQAAVDSGRPPLELILDEPDRPRCKWDGKLIKALYLNKAFEVDGYPVWVEESPDIVFEAKTLRIRSLKVVEMAQESHSNKKNPEKGVKFYAEANLKPGATWPTRKEWMDRKLGKVADAQKTGNDTERVQAAEERARAKVEADPEIARIVAEAEAKLKGRAVNTDKMD